MSISQVVRASGIILTPPSQMCAMQEINGQTCFPALIHCLDRQAGEAHPDRPIASRPAIRPAKRRPD